MNKKELIKINKPLNEANAKSKIAMDIANWIIKGIEQRREKLLRKKII